MADGHDYFEELAVGHVLGGLDAAVAAQFRTHLVGCPVCQQQVAELRDIASELAAAEKDERARERERVQTETTRRVDEEVPAPPSRRLRPRFVTAAVLVLVILGGGTLAFWNLHLRTTANVYGEVAERRGDALRTLGTGTAVPVDFADGVTGVVAADGANVAFSLGGLPALTVRQRVAVWLEGIDDQVAGDSGREGEPVLVLVAVAGQLDDGVFAARVADAGADQLVITLEEGDLGPGPAGRELARADLSGGGAGG